MKASVWTISETAAGEWIGDNMQKLDTEWDKVHDVLARWRNKGMGIEVSHDHDNGIIKYTATGGIDQPEGQKLTRIFYIKTRAQKTSERLWAELFDVPGTQYDQFA